MQNLKYIWNQWENLWTKKIKFTETSNRENLFKMF